MVGKTAALRVPLVEEERPKTQPVTRRRSRRAVAPLAAYGVFVATAVVLVLLYVAQYAYVAQLNLRLAQAQKDLAQVVTLQEQLEQEASELRSLSRIEREATQRLGMLEPERVQVAAALPKPPAKERVAPALAPVNVPQPRPDKVTAFLNWAQGLRRALAKGISEEN